MTLARAFAAELERALQRRQVDVGVTAFRRGSPSEASLRSGSDCLTNGVHLRSSVVPDPIVDGLVSEGELTIGTDAFCELTDKGRAKFVEAVKSAQSNGWSLVGQRSYRKRG
jgi:hypothetical protein